MARLKGPRTEGYMGEVGMGFMGRGTASPLPTTFLHLRNFVLNVPLKPNHPTIDPCFEYLHSTRTE